MVAEDHALCRCDLVEGIERALFSPFHYVGVPDEVDYTNIPWRSARFDEEALTNAVATQRRAQNALEQYRKHAGERTLGFCCSQRHADFMAQLFLEAGVRAAAVHTGPKSAPRARSLERLVEGELDVIFAVDIFNEGVDLPNVDTIMMLRPTESRILWIQQFGRGLRRAEGKERLTVVDYIGNHRVFLLKPQTLLNLGGSDRELALALDRLQRGELQLPPGCEVTYEFEAVNILRALLRVPKGPEALKVWYEGFKERQGTRPTALEAHHSGYAPRSVRKSHESWLGFVRELGDLSDAQRAALGERPAGDFLKELEITPMTKSYKMLLLLAVLNEDKLPGSIGIDELVRSFGRLARRNAVLRADVGDSLEDPVRLGQHLEKNPIEAWAGGRGTGGARYFAYENGALRTTFDVDPEHRQAFQELVREIADWRLGEYLDRGEGSSQPVRSLQIGESYSRKRIPGLFGARSSPDWERSGFVWQGKNMILLVTLEKAGQPKEHQYEDRFLSAGTFQWQSQNRTTQRGKVGQAIPNHLREGIRGSPLCSAKCERRTRNRAVFLLWAADVRELGGRKADYRALVTSARASREDARAPRGLGRDFEMSGTSRTLGGPNAPHHLGRRESERPHLAPPGGRPIDIPEPAR